MSSVTGSDTEAEAADKGVEDMVYMPKSEIWIIDCCPELFENGHAVDAKTTWWHELMEAAVESMKRSVFSRASNQFGIFLYNTKHYMNDMGIPGIYTLLNLDKIDAKRIKKIQRHSGISYDTFIKEFGGFADEPPLLAAKVFDISKFYIDILGITLEEAEAYPDASRVNLEMLKDRIRRKHFSQHISISQRFEITSDFSVSISIYYSIVPQTIPSPIVVSSTDLTPLQVQSTWVNKETGEAVDPNQIRYKAQFGEKTIYLTEQEREEALYVGEPAMKLLGFFPTSSLEVEHIIGHSYFVYPNDSDIPVSSVFLSALLQNMYLMKQAALVQWIPRHRQGLRFAALLPQLERVDESNIQIEPPGFHLLKLAFVEEVHDFEFPSTEMEFDETPDKRREQIELAKETLKCFLTDNFHPADIENPRLQQHYADIEAVALDLEKSVEISFDLRKNPEELETFKDTILSWKKSVYTSFSEEYIPSSPRSRSAKRDKKANEAGEPDLKKGTFKKEEMDDIIIKNCFYEETLDKLTVAQLKGWLTRNSLSGSGKKSDLVKRVEEAMRREAH